MVTVSGRRAARRIRLGAPPPAGGGPVAALTAPEVAVGAAVVLLGAVAWMSLLLADLHVHRLPTVLIATALVLAGGTALAWRRGGRVRVVADHPTLLACLGIGVLAALLFLPGFGYGVTDKDPGVYVAHALQIARGGSYSFHDQVLQLVPQVQLASPGARFPGIWIHDPATQTIVPQFYHLWPALLATSYDAGGLGGLVGTGPLAALLAVLALVVVLRRAFNLPVAVAGGLLLGTNMLEVWQAKYPTTEAFAQLLFLALLLFVVLALRTGWAPAAGLGGLFLGLSWLERPDALLLVFVAAGVGAGLVATGRFDRRCAWFAGGVAAVLPHALWQAYGGARKYTLANGVPSLGKVVGLVLGLFLLGVLLRVVGRPLGERVGRLLGDRRVQFGLGFALCAVAAGLLVLGFLRPRLSGPLTVNYNGTIIRTYDEINLRRLSWFITLPGFALMGLGLAVATLRRWTAAMWVLVLPTVLFLPVYAYQARNSPRLMWWARRWVPTVLPGILILVAVALGAAVVWRYRRRAPLRLPAVLALGALVAVFLGQSLPLRRHDEFGGSFAVTQRLAALAGPQRGVFLFQFPTYCCASPATLFGAAMWLDRGQYSALLPTRGDATAYVRRFRRAFPASPVFVVGEREQPPPGLTGLRLTPVATVRDRLPFWQESVVTRPDRAGVVRLGFTVYRVG